ncbi:BnaCnng08340D [Brassica napus]|uniref:BnaCnng08340D protein n=2 Tax=Brassica TaxID=3705 RepID=A0A078HK13_BRANA|nr:BnaCnng08340D [Brassica napus]
MNIVGLILCFEPISLCISTTNTVYCLQIQIYSIVPCYDCGSMHGAMQLNKVHYVMIGLHHRCNY